jgi:hypothetical protein
MVQGLAFQTIDIVDDGTDESRPLNPRDPPGLKVKLTERSSIALPKHPLTLRVNQEIELLAVRIRQMMQLRGGGRSIARGRCRRWCFERTSQAGRAVAEPGRGLSIVASTSG